jgi:hypothetical protein
MLNIIWNAESNNPTEEVIDMDEQSTIEDTTIIETTEAPDSELEEVIIEEVEDTDNLD